jgi:hypothetical protein
VKSAHAIIFDHIKNILKENPALGSGSSLDNMDQRKFCTTMFKNYTDNFPSLRLTSDGFLLLTKIYQSWSFPLGEAGEMELQKGQMILGLHRHVKVPYYWDRKLFYVFGNEYALEIEMVQRDFKHWCQSFL